MSYVSFEEVKAAVSIEKAINLLQLDMKKAGPEQYRGPCPACKASGERALAVNVGKASWYCFSAKQGGDVISLTAHIRGASQKDAAHWLMGTNDPQPRAAEPSNHSPSPLQKEAGMAALDYLEAEHPAVDAVGFPVDVAKAVGLGFASKGLMRGLVAVPLRLPDGTLIGYLGLDQARLPQRWQMPGQDQKVVPFQKKTA